jgi:hypothetical protein
MDAVSGFSVYLPENFRIDFSNLKRAEVQTPEPVTPGKTRLVVSGGSYGSTYSNKSPAENLRSFLAWKDELVKTLSSLKRPEYQEIPHLPVANDPRFQTRLMPNQINSAAAGSHIDLKV